MRNKTVRKILGFGLIALVTSAPAQAQIYKWTDENGRVHYSDRKPDAETDVSNVKVQTGKGTPAPNSSNSKPAKSEQAAKEEQLNAKAEELSQSEAKQEDIDRACSQARANLAKMADNPRMRINDGGEMRYLTPEEIAEKKQLNQDLINELCN